MVSGSWRLRALVCCGLLSGAACAAAQEAATAAPIVFGQSGEFSGQGVAKENTDGAQAYFAMVNRNGGVFGRKVELKSLDDSRDKKRVVQNTERLITQDKVFALFGYRSTPSVRAAIEVAVRERVPLIAPFSGAQSIRTPHNPLVFHLRDSYRREMEKLINLLVTQGVSKIAMLYQDDEFGKDALTGFEEAIKKAGITAVAVADYDRKDRNITPALKTLTAAHPQAVVMACTPKACVDFIKQAKAGGGGGLRFLTLSNVNSDEFTRELGEDGRGVMVSQVVPHPWSVGIPLVREFHRAIKDAGSQVPVSYSSFEGFIAAKLAVTALRQAGPNPTREKFMAALESMHDLDLGGMYIQMSASDHWGSSFVDLTMIGRDGKYVR